MALHNCIGELEEDETQSGLGHWHVHQEVLSRTVHAKLMGMSMPNARVRWHGVSLQMQHKKSTKTGAEKSQI